MTDTFDWKVEAGGSGGDGNFTVAKVKFGDGYSQFAKLGLNAEEQVWTVQRSGYGVEIDPVLAFIRAHAGQSFFWTPPRGVQGLYVCETYNLSPPHGDFYTLRMTFQQVYQPT